LALSLSGGRKKSLRDNTIIILASNNGGATSGLFAQDAKSKEEREHKESGIVQIQKSQSQSLNLLQNFARSKSPFRTLRHFAKVHLHRASIGPKRFT
jgi:hypothetical protein